MLWVVNWLAMLPVVMADNLCGELGPVIAHDIPLERNSSASLISSTANAAAESSQEWILKGDAKDFITVEFTLFNLSGPVCGDNATGYSTVKIETSLNGVTIPHYLFCKGRRSPVGEPISSMGTIQVAYCNHFAHAQVEFRVSTACNAILITRETITVISVHRSKATCWIHLKSLGEAGVVVDFSSISTKAKKKRCLGSFISVKEMTADVQKSLLSDGVDRMCSFEGSEPLSANYTFYTRSQGINITYKKAAFTLSFRELQQDQTVRPRLFPEPITTTISDNGTGAVLYDNSEEQRNGSINLIIGLGCGGLFVMLVIIATLAFLKRRSTRSQNRKESTKQKRKSTGAAEEAALVRAQSVGSIDNAMYGQVVGDDDTMTAKKKRERLSQLEDKYGPFAETSTSFRLPLNDGTNNDSLHSKIRTPNQYPILKTNTEQKVKPLRKGTRPQMPLPKNYNASTSPNLYETIEEIQSERLNSNQNKEDRISYFSLTSDEFSDVDQLPLPNTSYDSVPQESSYAAILDGPSVSYDKVDDEEEQRICIPVAEYVPGPMADRPPEVKYRKKHKKKLPQTQGIITLTPPVAGGETSRSTPILSGDDAHYQTPNRASQRQLHPHKHRATSHGVIAHVHRSNEARFAPRPSLPEIIQRQGYANSIDSLQEDAENYLRPRPSCPDAMIACAYSSSEDVSEIKRRILAAAHPSLLDNNSTGSGASESDTEMKACYDSPRPSAGNELTLPPTAHYASPRRQNKKSNPSR